jgi:hypothetical protein
MYRLTLTALLALVGFVGSAHAVPVQWTLQGMTFSNGSTATGSFDFDIDTNTFSNIAIAVTAATDYSGFQAQTFNAIAPSSGNYYGAIFTTLPLWYDNVSPSCGENAWGDRSGCGTNGLYLSLYPAAMTNAGGVLSANSFLGYCSSDACNTGSWGFRGLTSMLTTGTITTVPEAEAYAMMLAGLGLVGWAARRRRQVH